MDHLTPNVDFREIRNDLKASLRAKDRVVIPQQAPGKPKRKFGSIQTSKVRIGALALPDGTASVAQEDLFRKRNEVKHAKSVKSRGDHASLNGGEAKRHSTIVHDTSHF